MDGEVVVADGVTYVVVWNGAHQGKDLDLLPSTKQDLDALTLNQLLHVRRDLPPLILDALAPPHPRWQTVDQIVEQIGWVDTLREEQGGTSGYARRCARRAVQGMLVRLLLLKRITRMDPDGRGQRPRYALEER